MQFSGGFRNDRMDRMRMCTQLPATTPIGILLRRRVTLEPHCNKQISMPLRPTQCPVMAGRTTATSQYGRISPFCYPKYGCE
eukprot:2600563-Pyramimonas_sp.AAC.1